MTRSFSFPPFSLVFSVAIVLAIAVAAKAAPSGASGVAVADPGIPVPDSPTTVVPLFEWTQFFGYGPHSFDYTPPPAIVPSTTTTAAGTARANVAAFTQSFAKIVVYLHCNCSKGRQFDRTVSLSVGNAVLLFGTTQEPSKLVAPSWTISADVTAYGPLLASPQMGSIELDTVVSPTYNGVPACRSEMVFFAATAQFPAPSRQPSLLIPFGLVQSVLNITDLVISLPSQAQGQLSEMYMSIFLQNQYDDEFFWSCLPSNLSGLVGTCGSSSVRYAQISLDGQLAAIVPAYPYIFSGGVDPFLWRPSMSPRSLNMVPYKVDLSCFAGMLSEPASSTTSSHSTGCSENSRKTKNHTLTITMCPESNNYWMIGATLFGFSDPLVDKMTLEENTLPVALAAAGSGRVVATLAGNASQQSALGWANVSFAVSGHCSAVVNKRSRSTGAREVLRIETRTSLEFSNSQFYNQTGASITQPGQYAYSNTYQKTLFTSTLLTYRGGNSGNDVIQASRSNFFFPLTVIEASLPYAANKSLASQFTSISAEFSYYGMEKQLRSSGPEFHEFSTRDSITSADNVLFEAANSDFVSNTNQSSQNTFAFSDDQGNCFQRAVAVSNNSVVQQNTVCNSLAWDVNPFDALLFTRLQDHGCVGRGRDGDADARPASFSFNINVNKRRNSAMNKHRLSGMKRRWMQ